MAKERVHKEHFLEHILGSLPHSFYVINAKNYRVMCLNKAVQKELPKNATCYELSHQRDKPCTEEHICPLKEIKKTKKSVIVEHVHNNGSGNPRIIEVHGHPIFNDKGDVVQIIEYNIDITERKELQKELMQSEKMAAIGTLSANMAHELRNPLSVISAAIYNLKQHIKCDEYLIKQIGTISNKILEMDRIIMDLLNYSRVRQSPMVDMDMNMLVKEVLHSIEAEFAETEVKIIKKLDNIPKIKVDRLQICEVFQNIFRNAYEAMPEGGEITLSSKHIEKDKAVEISISDTGIGIPKDNIHKLSEPFYSTKDDGTGLGLALAFCVVKERHKGSIGIKSDPGKGTKFTVKLPV